MSTDKTAFNVLGKLLHERASRKQAVPKREVMTQHGPMFVPLSSLEKLAAADDRAGQKPKPKPKKPTGMFRGVRMSPDGKKFSVVFQGIPVTIDRPKGFIMSGEKNGKPWKRQYKYHYGYIPRTKGGDGDQLDVFIGPNKKSATTFWAIQNKDDGTFDEYKVFLGFDNRDEATVAYRSHIPKKLLKGMVTMRLDMMKAMLGIGPDGIQKAAAVSLVSFLDEKQKIGGLLPSEVVGVLPRLTRKGIVHELGAKAKRDVDDLKKDVRKSLT